LIAFETVSAAFGGTLALSEVTFTVARGELCVLVGPSGSGKSTLLRLVNRLVEPTRGRVLVRGRDVTTLEPAPLRRSIGYVIQSTGLFPHRNVADNVATVPRLLGWSSAAIESRVAEMLDLVHLDPAVFAKRFPAELSGGQAQRVGLARALAADPDILLMDEPFGAVDPIIRRDLRAELKRIHAKTGKTILLVTHDPVEALELATQIVVVRGGQVVAAGSPLDLTNGGGDAFTRDLFGGEALALRRLRFTSVADVMSAGEAAGAPTIGADATLREALARMIEAKTAHLSVTDAEGRQVGHLTVDALLERYR
jgi:osmoprotectant transport system ATP-binding protein